jgi:hypothetical protein
VIRLQVGLKGSEALDRRLSLAEDVVQDLRPTFEEIAHPWLLNHMRRQFATDGAHGGSRWADYSREPKYRAYKKSLVGHTDILRWEKGGREQLYPSLTKKGDSLHVWRASHKGIRFGTRVDHAERLTQGGTGPFGEPYPGREIFSLTRRQRSDFVREIQRDIIRRFGRDAFRR